MSVEIEHDKDAVSLAREKGTMVLRVERHAVTTIDPTRSHARLTFDAAPAEALSGSEGHESVRHLLAPLDAAVRKGHEEARGLVDLQTMR